MFFVSIVKTFSLGFADLSDFIVVTEGAADGDSLGLVDGGDDGFMEASFEGVAEGAVLGTVEVTMPHHLCALKEKKTDFKAN